MPIKTDFTKEQLHVVHARSVALGVALFVCDLVGYLICVASVAHARSWPVQALFAAAATIFVGRLFMLGHDACHQSLTPNRWLNRWLGTFAFLPSLHPYSLWDLGHNRIHHRFTNQRGLDYVWEPLDPAEYAQLSAFAQWRYRVFRTPLGHLAYYGSEIWWRKMFLPRSREIGGYRREYFWDHVPVIAWALLMPALLIALRHDWVGADTPWSDLAATVFWGAVMPIAGFNVVMSSLIYLHHTHPAIVWTRAADVVAGSQITGAVHVVMPAVVERALHHIMDHPAHHARPGIPMYRLDGAEALLEQRHDGVIIAQWSVAFHLDTLRRCKLFDLKARDWVQFDGAPL